MGLDGEFGYSPRLIVEEGEGFLFLNRSDRFWNGFGRLRLNINRLNFNGFRCVLASE